MTMYSKRKRAEAITIMVVMKTMMVVMETKTK
jgi:hypothetical protein